LTIERFLITAGAGETLIDPPPQPDATHGP
jgi:hypothetical protein